jgi:hypothetical protein
MFAANYNCYGKAFFKIYFVFYQKYISQYKYPALTGYPAFVLAGYPVKIVSGASLKRTLTPSTRLLP